MMPWSQVTVLPTQIITVLLAAQPSDTNMALGGNPDYRPLRGPSVAPGATDINSGPLGCFRASNLGSSPGQDITLALGGKQAMHISLFLTTLTSSICRSPQPTECSLSLFFPILFLLTIVVLDHTVPEASGRLLVESCPPQPQGMV